MQPIGYLIVVFIVILLFTILLMFTISTTKVKSQTINTPIEKKVSNTPIEKKVSNTPIEKKVSNTPIVNLPSKKDTIEPPKQIAYNPDQPDYHPGDGAINTGVAPTEAIDIPNEFSYDYDVRYKCDMGVLLGDACSHDSYIMQPTDLFQNLKYDEAESKISINPMHSNLKIIKVTDENMINPNFVPKYDVEYYNEACRSGYKRTEIMNPEEYNFTFHCASDKNTTPATRYCDYDDILKDNRCIVPDYTGYNIGLT
jgi:hypothetical protein